MATAIMLKERNREMCGIQNIAVSDTVFIACTKAGNWYLKYHLTAITLPVYSGLYMPHY